MTQGLLNLSKGFGGGGLFSGLFSGGGNNLGGAMQLSQSAKPSGTTVAPPPATYTNQMTGQQSLAPTQAASFFRDETGGLNLGNLGTVLGGAQAIGNLWNSFQQNKLAKDQMRFQKDAYRTNLENSTQTYNTALEDRIRSRYNTEGRSDQETESYLNKNRL